MEYKVYDSLGKQKETKKFYLQDLPFEVDMPQVPIDPSIYFSFYCPKPEIVRRLSEDIRTLAMYPVLDARLENRNIIVSGLS